MTFRQPPTTARRVGFEIDPPTEISVQTHGAAIRCQQLHPSGAPIGELELEVFHAALVIDRDGILEEKVAAAIARVAAPGAQVLHPVPVELAGASGFRADSEPTRAIGADATRAPLPYVHVIALAPDDLGVDGGILITIRSASPTWPAAEKLVQSLRILSRRSTSANDR
jgi:hypothetical protein